MDAERARQALSRQGALLYIDFFVIRVVRAVVGQRVSLRKQRLELKWLQRDTN